MQPTRPGRGARELRQRFCLYLITDDQGRSPQDLAAIVEQAIAGGVTAVQLREKSASQEMLRQSLDLLLRVCRRAGAALMVNADLLEPLAGPQSLSECDGIHFGARTLFGARTAAHGASAEPWRAGHVASVHPPLAQHALCAWQPGRWLLGYSAHALEEARALLDLGASFATLSPVFETPSKQGILEPCGTSLLARARGALPEALLIGLGGVSVANASQVAEAGADGVAVMRAIMQASDPRQAARELRRAVDEGLARRRA